MSDNNKRICPVERASGLDNSFRRLLQSPKRILKPYIKSGMTVLDFGCGPGFFTIEIAKMLGNSGKVIAADLQQGMLEIVRNKITGNDLENKVQLHKCEEESIGISEKVDFIFAFYAIHEAVNLDKTIQEFASILNPAGLVLIVDPKFHVSNQEFETMIEKMVNIGFKLVDRPKIALSRSALLM